MEFPKDKWRVHPFGGISYEGSSHHLFIYPKDFEPLQIDRDVHIAAVREFWDDDEKGGHDRCRANAILIASAPELYAIVEKLAECQSHEFSELKRQAHELIVDMKG